MKRRDYMKKLKHVMAGIVFTFAVGLMLSCQVKAETTIDLNGNKVEVSVWTKQTSMKDGSYKIISSEAGTIAYFDKDGNLLKVENKATGKIIMNNMKEPETTTKQPETSVKAADKITMPKVKKLKKKTKYSYYKGVKSVKKNGKPNWGKIKYKYGIKLTWSKVKNAKGYEVYRYENAKGCWTKIKTVKKPTYTLTNMLEGEKVKIRVRAYKKTKSGNEYGKYSGVLSFKTKRIYTKVYNNAKTKNFYSKFSSEDAFVYQNKLRKKEGVAPLKWSDVLYVIAVQRTKDKESKPHEKMHCTIENVLERKFDIDNENASCFAWFCSSENLYFGTSSKISNAVWNWYDEKNGNLGNGGDGKGHYRNVVNKEWLYGTICIRSDGKRTAGIYANKKYDGESANLDSDKNFIYDFSFLK